MSFNVFIGEQEISHDEIVEIYGMFCRHFNLRYRREVELYIKENPVDHLLRGRVIPQSLAGISAEKRDPDFALHHMGDCLRHQDVCDSMDLSP